MRLLSSLSVLCLAYNEEENLRWAIPQLLSICSELAGDFEIVVVAHSRSTDGTVAYLEEACKTEPRIRTVFQPANVRGYGPAFAHGLKHLTGEFAFHTDIDGQFLFEDLFRAAKILVETGADLIHFNRRRRKDPLERKIIGLGFKLLVHSLYRCPVWDFDSAFNLFRTSLLEGLELESDSGMAVPEFMIRAGRKKAKIITGWTEHQPRRAGKPVWEIRTAAPIILPDAGIVKANLCDLWRLRRSLRSRF